jgi:hypothetical protein
MSGIGVCCHSFREIDRDNEVYGLEFNWNIRCVWCMCWYISRRLNLFSVAFGMVVLIDIC